MMTIITQTFTYLFPVIVASIVMTTPAEVAVTPVIQGIAGIGECAHTDVVGATHWYNWSPGTLLNCSAEFQPMMRDEFQAQALQDGALGIQPGEWFMSFNEPEKCPYQACISPEDAVPIEHWKLAKYPGLVHVSPANSHEDLMWLKRMRNLYIDEYGEPPDWDIVATHCYFWDDHSLESCKSVVEYYINLANTWGADGVAVTEFASFAFRGNPADEFDYAPAVQRGREFIRWMNDKPEILGYFWFSAKDWGVWEWYATTALFDSDNNLTPLGEMYREELE